MRVSPTTSIHTATMRGTARTVCSVVAIGVMTCTIRVTGHSSLIRPFARNAVDRDLPQWKVRLHQVDAHSITPYAAVSSEPLHGDREWHQGLHTCRTVLTSACAEGIETCIHIYSNLSRRLFLQICVCLCVCMCMCQCVCVCVCVCMRFPNLCSRVGPSNNAGSQHTEA